MLAPEIVTTLRLRSIVMSHVLRARMAGRLSGPLGFFGENEVVPLLEELPPAAPPPSALVAAVSDSSMRNFFTASISSFSDMTLSSEEVSRMIAKRSAARVESICGLNLESTFAHI